MQYMIIERFHPGKVRALYERFGKSGRMLPEGVDYINSWIDRKLAVCYQLMEADAEEKIQEWIRHWDDLADFEIIPVMSSAEARKKVFAADI
jgi:hypothetical protein